MLGSEAVPSRSRHRPVKDGPAALGGCVPGPPGVRQLTHDSDDVDQAGLLGLAGPGAEGGPGQRRRPVAGHAAVDGQVDGRGPTGVASGTAYRVEVLDRADGEVHPGGEAGGEVPVHGVEPTEDRCGEAVRAQRECLGQRGHAEADCPVGQRGSRDLRGTQPVAVGLDDGEQRWRQRREAPGVGADRRQVNVEDGARGGSGGTEGNADGRAHVSVPTGRVGGGKWHDLDARDVPGLRTSTWSAVGLPPGADLPPRPTEIALARSSFGCPPRVWARR